MTEVITFEELKDKFKLTLEQKNNKQYSIETEIDKLKDFVSLNPNYERLKSYFGVKIYLDSKLLLEAFESFINDEEYIIEQRYHEQDLAFEVRKKGIIQIKQLVNYYNWLSEQKSSLTNKSNTKKNELTHKQKMLALYYLGLDMSKYDNTASAKILSQILGLDYQNTRQYLSYVSGGKNIVRTKSNLEKLAYIFESQELTDISDTIKDDLKAFPK